MYLDLVSLGDTFIVQKLRDFFSTIALYLNNLSPLLVLDDCAIGVESLFPVS